MKRDIRIALVSCSCLAGGTESNLEKIESWCNYAAQMGAGIVCFPELSITGYHIRGEIADSAEPVPGPSSKRIASAASELGISILAGIAEKTEDCLFASHILAEAGSGITGIYRKVHPGPPERNIFNQGPGDSLLFETMGLKLGIQLCYDAHFPGLSTKMAAEGADIIFMPHASPGGSCEEKLGSWMRHMPARAFDNSIYVAAVNMAGQNGRGLSFPAVAAVFSPEGKIICRHTCDHETILLADLSCRDLESVRAHSMKYFLPHRRPEVYKW